MNFPLIFKSFDFGTKRAGLGSKHLRLIAEEFRQIQFSLLPPGFTLHVRLSAPQGEHRRRCQARAYANRKELFRCVSLCATLHLETQK